jgi:hypothetical protein
MPPVHESELYQTDMKNNKPLRNVGSGKANAERGKKKHGSFRTIDGIGDRALTKVLVNVCHSLCAWTQFSTRVIPAFGKSKT